MGRLRTVRGASLAHRPVNVHRRDDLAPLAARETLRDDGHAVTGTDGEGLLSVIVSRTPCDVPGTLFLDTFESGQELNEVHTS
jgi:hypothetical protein